MPRGSAPGERRGGRKKGTLNKRTQALMDAQATIIAAPIIGENGELIDMPADVTPLNFFLTLMKSPFASLDVRFDAAKAAAPYVHPKLNSVEHKGDGVGGNSINITFMPSDGAL